MLIYLSGRAGIKQHIRQSLENCNVKVSPSDHFSFCEACQYGKIHLLPFKSYSSHAKEPLELVHTDVWGLHQ